jgi:hypothetical protein
MPLTPEVIQIVIQGGAVGLLLVFGAAGFTLAKLAINKVSDFVTNHLAHNTQAINDNTLAMAKTAEIAQATAEKTALIAKMTAEETARVAASAVAAAKESSDDVRAAIEKLSADILRVKKGV